jgi:capsular exopolysaccharide synthesis family protein
MSRILDVLQQAQAERSGQPISEMSSVTELLLAAESPQGLASEEAGDPPVQPGHVAEVSRAAEYEIKGFEEFRSLRPSFGSESRLVCMTNLGCKGAEKFRLLAVRLRQLQQNRALKKILITSALPEEGKSVIAANLALTLARRSLPKVLLLDGDLRRPTLAQQFGLNCPSGLTELLQGESSLAASIYYLEEPKLWFMPAGSVPPNPLELMQSGRLSGLFVSLTALFDWIVIDSSPVVGLADSSVWARLADGIVLVAREGKTEKRSLRKGLEMLEGSSLLGVVLNSSSNNDSSYYYQPYGTTTSASKKAHKKESSASR